MFCYDDAASKLALAVMNVSVQDCYGSVIHECSYHFIYFNSRNHYPFLYVVVQFFPWFKFFFFCLWVC